MKTKNRNWLCLSIVMGFQLIYTFSCSKDDGNNNPSTSITDKDGNVYTSVIIGTQTWMVENLKTTKYNDGTAIPNVTDLTEWAALTTPAYCWYNEDAANKTPYGALYNWYVINTGKLCPTGWHVPSMDERDALFTFLGDNWGGKLKEKGTNHWNSPNAEATNESGFTGLPGGMLNYYSYPPEFRNLRDFGWWWTSTEYAGGPGTIHTWNLTSTDGIAYSFQNYKQDGLSVRCIKN